MSFHHMNKFVHEPILHYQRGEILIIRNLDKDRWSYFEAMGIFEELGSKDLQIDCGIFENHCSYVHHKQFVAVFQESLISDLY